MGSAKADSATKIVRNTAKPPAAGKGRPKGARNKTTTAVKEMIEQALEKSGGVEYLERQARDNPQAFLTLVGKVLPLQVNQNSTHTFSQLPSKVDDFL